MGDSQAIIRLADQPGDLGWIVMAHGELYAREFKAGFVLSSAAPEHHFGVDLISQTYELNLR